MKEPIRGDGAIHTWFELTYSNYLVMPRSILQSMPQDWQTRFVELLEEVSDLYTFPQAGYGYNVLLRNKESGRYANDPLSGYDRGRRYVEPNLDVHADLSKPVGSTDTLSPEGEVT